MEWVIEKGYRRMELTWGWERDAVFAVDDLGWRRRPDDDDPSSCRS